MRILLLSSAAAFPLASLAASAGAQSPPPDKDDYSLLDPTPRELWRPLSADRPDFTESPYTVDAGAVQLELSFVDYVKNGETETWTAAAANLKVGLLNDVDLQMVFDPYVHEDDGTASADGFGDMQVRLKVNLWGNDGGDTALALMPFIKVPTASGDLGNDHVEGGLIVPFATRLNEDVGLGLMFEADFVYDTVDDGYDTEFVTTGVIGVDLTEAVGVYVEGIGITSTDAEDDFRGILGLGATWGVQENLVFDAGVNIGLTGNADDINVFSGVTVRF